MKRGMLKVLMQEMADLTSPECAMVCRAPHTCCDELYCEIAFHYARRNYGVELHRTDHPKLWFMTETGCTVEPHLRPMCTLHVCSIQAFGQKQNDPEFNEYYYTLRNKVDDLLYEVEKEKQNDSGASNEL